MRFDQAVKHAIEFLKHPDNVRAVNVIRRDFSWEILVETPTVFYLVTFGPNGENPWTKPHKV